MCACGPNFQAVIAAIDAANGQDPKHLQLAGRLVPAALIYGQRMSETLARLAPEAGELLQIAARGQHIERWTSPRDRYPAGRAGYLCWRQELKDYHARRVAEIMAACGFGRHDIARVVGLIGKEGLRSDPDAQLLEDVVCVVFLQHYAADFAAKTEQPKLGKILAKTWNKMSAHGHAHALRLDLPPPVRRLLARGALP